MRVIRITLVLLSIFIRTADVSAQGGRFSARASVDSTGYLVGDGIHVRIDLRHPKGAVLRPLIGDTLNGFFTLERQPLVPRSDTTSAMVLVVAKYDSGDAVLPPLQFAVSVPGDSARMVMTNPVRLTIHTVEVDTSKEIRDLKPPLSIALTTAEILMYSGIVLLLLAAGYAGYRLWKKYKAGKAGGEGDDKAPTRPAHVIALEQLAILKEKKLWEHGHVKQFYSEITEIFRRYLENRYSMMAMEETTDEIMQGLRRLRFPEAMREEAERILRRADLVKFAKYQPVPKENEEMFTVVRDVVEKTRIVQLTPVSPEQSKAPAHAAT